MMTCIESDYLIVDFGYTGMHLIKRDKTHQTTHSRTYQSTGVLQLHISSQPNFLYMNEFLLVTPYLDVMSIQQYTFKEAG